MFFRFITLFCLSVGIHAHNGSDYRIGLHTHMGYPSEMAAAYDLWAEGRFDGNPHWSAMDTDGLLAHADRFAPDLLVHGGLAWEVRRLFFTLNEPFKLGAKPN